MLRTPNFGRKSLNEIKEILSTMNLELGMKIEDGHLKISKIFEKNLMIPTKV